MSKLKQKNTVLLQTHIFFGLLWEVAAEPRNIREGEKQGIGQVDEQGCH